MYHSDHLSILARTLLLIFGRNDRVRSVSLNRKMDCVYNGIVSLRKKEADIYSGYLQRIFSMTKAHIRFREIGEETKTNGARFKKCVL